MNICVKYFIIIVHQNKILITLLFQRLLSSYKSFKNPKQLDNLSFYDILCHLGLEVKVISRALVIL